MNRIDLQRALSLKAFATVDLLVAIVLVAGMIGIVAFYLNRDYGLDVSVTSCNQETRLLADVAACARGSQASGEVITCASVDTCVANSASMTAKWPGIITDGAGNISIGSDTSNYEVTCSGTPPELKMHCYGNAAPSSAQAVCGDNTITPPEVCDDGNTVNNHRCSANCMTSCPTGEIYNGTACCSEDTNNPGNCVVIANGLWNQNFADACASGAGTWWTNYSYNYTNIPVYGSFMQDVASAICTYECGSPQDCSTGSCYIGTNTSDCPTSTSTTLNDISCGGCYQTQSYNPAIVCGPGGALVGTAACSGGGGPVIPVCGDANQDGSEICDDGNTNNFDRCSSNCATTCPAGQIFNGTACCTENTTNPGTCSVAVCGDNTLTLPEVCDDGNTNNNDRCSSSCSTSCAVGQIYNGTGCCTESTSNPGTCVSPSTPSWDSSFLPGGSNQCQLNIPYNSMDFPNKQALTGLCNNQCQITFGLGYYPEAPENISHPYFYLNSSFYGQCPNNGTDWVGISCPCGLWTNQSSVGQHLSGSAYGSNCGGSYLPQIWPCSGTSP